MAVCGFGIMRIESLRKLHIAKLRSLVYSFKKSLLVTNLLFSLSQTKAWFHRLRLSQEWALVQLRYLSVTYFKIFQGKLLLVKTAQ